MAIYFRDPDIQQRYVSPSGKSWLRLETNSVLGAMLSKVPPDAVILDVGTAGNTNRDPFLVGRNVRTLDVNPQYKPDIVADIQDTLLPTASVDAIVLNQVLEHIFDTRRAIAECYRILRPDGHLVIAVPWDYPYHMDDGFEDYWRISAAALRELLHEFTGVDVVKERWGTYALARKPA